MYAYNDFFFFKKKNSSLFDNSNIVHPLEYWEMASRGGDLIDIKMCELALHYLTPPASSVDIERLFSTAADITTNDRNRINPEKAEKALFCHKNLHQINSQY